MPAYIERLWLLAAWRTNWEDPFDGVYFKSNTREVWAIFAVMAVLVVAAVLWQLLTSRTYGRLPSNSSRSLFRELSRAHGLDRSRRRLLKRLAAAQGVAPPVLLFVQPERFALVGLPEEMYEHAADIEELEQRLFGERDSLAAV